MRKALILIFTLFVLSTNLFCKNKLISTIPFEMVGSYIVVNVKVNNSTPLKMILDTGVRSTIITELFPDDNVEMQNGELRELQGLGAGNQLFAFESDSNNIMIGKFELKNRLVYVLPENIFKLTNQTGTKINGLLGVDMFRNNIVQLDYTARKIRIYDYENFEAPKNYGVMPMIIQRQKLFIQLSVLETDSAKRSIKMLIDTGAELSAWFQTLTNKAITIPEKSIKGRIGQGLSGEVNGIFARIPQICIANFCVKNPIVAFPDSSSISGIIQNTDRDGTIGSQLLSRFNLIIDTQNKKFYFKPNENFKKSFVFNIAGIEIAQSIALLPQVEIVNIWKGSPAEQAGLEIGDIINEINYQKAFSLNLSEIRIFFERPSKLPLKLLVSRGGVTKEFSLNMKAKI
jgi:hypothetical protein